MNNGKSLGLNEFPCEIFKTMWNTIVGDLLIMDQENFKIGRVIEFLNQDVVKVHPKNISTRDTISGWASTTLNISYKSCPKNFCNELKMLLPRL